MYPSCSDYIRAVANDDKARERILTNACAVIASPVTMQGGASAFYRRRLEGDPKNAVILPSNAAAAYGSQRTEGEEAQWWVERVSFAAHCTQDELLGITKKLSPLDPPLLLLALDLVRPVGGGGVRWQDDGVLRVPLQPAAVEGARPALHGHR